MKSVLVTRAVHQAGEFVQKLTDHGFSPLLFPMIEIVPPVSWELCDKAIDSLYMYDGLIFTSANGVDFFFNRLADRNIPRRELQTKIICVVGEKTKTVCEKFGLTVTTMPEKFTSNDLFNALKQQDVRDRVFLHPKGNLGKESLSGNLKLLGAKVDSVIVYQTIQPKQTDVELIKLKLLKGEIDVITFTSPSTVKNFCLLFSPSELNTISSFTHTVVIGPVTESTARDLGFNNVTIATISTIDGLIETISQLSE